MLGYRRRLDEIVREQLYPAATTRGGLRHRRRANGLCVLDLGGADSHLQSNLWRRGDCLSPGGLLDDLLHGLGGSFRSLRGLWCQPLHRHPCRDVTALSSSTCQRDDKCISAYDYSSKEPYIFKKGTHLRQRWLPATTPRQPEARALLGQRERPPRRAARLLPPLLKRAHLPPRTNPWTSCRNIHRWASVTID
jgi:hypothetical protein